jgi:hypothetical protein
MKKIILFVIGLMLMSSGAQASKATVPLNHQELTSMGCVDTGNSNEIEYLNCDASGNLSVVITPAIGASFINAVVNIALAGPADRTQLPSNSVTSCILQAMPSNAGPVYFGGSTVTNSSGANEGIRLNQNDSIAFTTDDTDTIYVAADNAGDDVKILCN